MHDIVINSAAREPGVAHARILGQAVVNNKDVASSLGIQTVCYVFVSS